MGLTKPGHGDTVWIEYPEGKHFRALYDSQSDTFTPQGERPIKAADVANWSYEEHEDYDASGECTAGAGQERVLLEADL